MVTNKLVHLKEVAFITAANIQGGRQERARMYLSRKKIEKICEGGLYLSFVEHFRHNLYDYIIEFRNASASRYHGECDAVRAAGLFDAVAIIGLEFAICLNRFIDKHKIYPQGRTERPGTECSDYLSSTVIRFIGCLINFARFNTPFSEAQGYKIPGDKNHSIRQGSCMTFILRAMVHMYEVVRNMKHVYPFVFTIFLERIVSREPGTLSEKIFDIELDIDRRQMLVRFREITLEEVVTWSKSKLAAIRFPRSRRDYIQAVQYQYHLRA